jgi:tRNA(adenine34) deaminase
MALAEAIVSQQDEAFMRLALQQAVLASAQGEVPVGAVVVIDGAVVGTGYNSPIQSCDPSAHAEVNALRMAARTLGNYRLERCTLYVTLEPCAMCCGAMLHSRLQRVVYGATEPNTGCAGSVRDLFADTQLNHQTVVRSGVLAAEAATLLQDFFRDKRLERRDSATPLREDSLRTPDACFAGLADYPWPGHYVSDLPSLAGLRMHYLDLGSPTSKPVFLCLHPIPGWSYSQRHTISQLVEQGTRVVAPDLVGFGKSDKPKREHLHTLEWHQRCLQELVASLALQQVVLVVPDACHPLLRSLMGSPLCPVQTLSVQPAPPGATDSVGLNAPYPDAGHRAAERALAAQRK